MQKQTNNSAAMSKSMNVTIVRFGYPATNVTVPVGSTVSDVVRAGNLQLEGNEDMFVEGVRAESNDILEAGDMLSVVTPKQAG